ncbi:MAG: PKD domain-containing protein [Methanomicrobiales archaeon]
MRIWVFEAKKQKLFHCALKITALLLVLAVSGGYVAGAGDQNLSSSLKSLGPVNESLGNITTINQTIFLVTPAENVTSLINTSDTRGQDDPKTGNTTPALNNSFQVNNGDGFPLKNENVTTNESVEDTHFPVVNNSSETPVSYHGLEIGSLTLLSTSSLSNSYQPKIDGKNIVWSTVDPVNQTSGIVLYNITEGNELPLTSPGNLDHVNPSISGNYVVYSGQAQDDPVYRIYLYRIDTGTTSRLTSPDDQSYRVLPAISGDYVVWSEFDTGYGRIVLHNLQTSSSSVISPVSEILDNSYPSISGDYVVWQAMNNSDWTYSVWFHQISTNTTIRLTSPERSASQQAPSISGDRIVYVDGFGGEWDIVEYSIPENKSQKISLQKIVNNNPQTAIDGNLIAWVDMSEAYGSVYLFDRLNRTVSLLTLADLNYSSNIAPSISGDRIVWECNDLGKIDVFMFTRGSPADRLVADFSVNRTIGSSPLVIRFKDLTSGSPTAWNWDFGDGTEGAGQEVLHTYENPGLYSVTLTVNNQFYRNATCKVDLINVASPPEAGFGTNINSGPAPLTVQFVDFSIGSPVNWSWDFGDGGHDNSTSPLHTYQEPGVYSPRLMVANDFGNTSVAKENQIVVLPASHTTSTSGLDGLLVFKKEGTESIALNITQFVGSYFIRPGNNALELNLFSESWIKEIVLYSGGNEGFTLTPEGFIVGNISDIEVTTRDIQGGSPGGTVIPDSNFNITLNLKSTPIQGELETTSWDGITPSDLLAFNRAIDYAGFVGISGSIYSVQVDTPGIEPAGNVTLRFSVNSSWVEDNGGRNAVYVLRKANDGGLEVLPTIFIGNNSEENLDYFMADSPRGLSTFVISSLHGSGNPLQLFYMSVSSRITPTGNTGGGGGGGGGGGSYGGSGSQVTSVPEPDASKGSQSGIVQDGAAMNAPSNDGQSGFVSQESVLPDQPPANPVPKVSYAPAPNPPALPLQPTSSVFTILIEAAAMISVVMIVVFSVSLRYRRREKD